MKRIPSLPISILSVLLLAIPACEDKDEKDRPQELVGTWFMHDSVVKMKLTSNINIILTSISFRKIKSNKQLFKLINLK